MSLDALAAMSAETRATVLWHGRGGDDGGTGGEDGYGSDIYTATPSAT